MYTARLMCYSRYSSAVIFKFTLNIFHILKKTLIFFVCIRKTRTSHFFSSELKVSNEGLHNSQPMNAADVIVLFLRFEATKPRIESKRFVGMTSLISI